MINPFTGLPTIEKALTPDDKANLLLDEKWLNKLRAKLYIPGGGNNGGGGAVFNLADHTTDELPVGTTNLYSQWKEVVTAGTNTALTPKNSGDFFTLGDTGGVDDLINSLGNVITAMFISPNTTGINFFANAAFGSASFLPIGGAYLAGHAGGTATAPTATPALTGLGVYAFLAHDDSFWAANSANAYSIVPGIYGKALTQPLNNSYDFQGWAGSILYQHFTWTAAADGTMTAKINEGNNTMTTTIGSAGGTAVTVDGSYGGVAAVSTGSVAGLSSDATGGTGNGLTVKAAVNSNTFQFQKPDGTNLWRSQWDTGNFHQYLNGSLYFNLQGAANFVIDGNGYSNLGLVVSNGAELKLDSSISGTTPDIRMGGGSYATAGVPLTTGALYWSNTWAWNGSNGYSINTQHNLEMTQLSTTAGDAEVRWKNNAAGIVMAMGLLNSQTMFANGAAATPSIALYNSNTTGFYRKGSNNLGLSAAGNLIVDWSTTTETYAEAYNIAFGTTTGTKIGTATTQKIGFWNATPVARPSAYTPTNVTTDRSYDANATSIDELADVLGTLIADLQSIGLVG